MSAVTTVACMSTCTSTFVRFFIVDSIAVVHLWKKYDRSCLLRQFCYRSCDYMRKDVQYLDQTFLQCKCTFYISL